MEKPYMVSETIKFSDGTETVLKFNKNGEAESIEEASAELVASHQDPVEEIIVESDDSEEVDAAEEGLEIPEEVIEE